MPHTNDPFDVTGNIDLTDQSKTVSSISPAFSLSLATVAANQAAVQIEGTQPEPVTSNNVDSANRGAGTYGTATGAGSGGGTANTIPGHAPQNRT